MPQNLGLVTVSFVMLCGGCGFSMMGGGSVKKLDQTENFQSDSQFHFTISPDDRWLVFFARVTADEMDSRHYLFGNLRVLDLAHSRLREDTLQDGVAPNASLVGDASWTPDSKYCVLPPPNEKGNAVDHGVLIDTHDENEVRITAIEVQNGTKRAVRTQAGKLDLPDHFTCSDCFPLTNDIELMKKHVEAKYLHWNGPTDQSAAQIVSPDGSKIYFQRGPEQRPDWEEVSLYEFDIATSRERKLTTHKGPHARIDYLRAAPDGKHLAYQLTFDIGFMVGNGVHVLDLDTDHTRRVGTTDGGTMHWTSTSDRLFYYYRDYLWVAQLGEPSPAQTQPNN